MDKVRISGLGCTLLDFVFDGVDFNGKAFRSYASKATGDGGLVPGQLVFLEELEAFSGEQFEKISMDIVGDRDPDVYNVGGPAIVSIIHAAQLLGGDAEIRFIASLGRDWVADRLLGILSKTPVSASEFLYRNDRTPFTTVLSDPDFDRGRGERTFINNIGAAEELLPRDLPNEFLETDLLVLGGTALVPGIHDRLDEILDRCENNTYIIVNTVFDFRNESKSPGKPWPIGKDHSSFKRIDLLIMDHQEALKISGKETLSTAVEYFRDSPLKSFIITDGPNPVIMYTSGGKKDALLRIPVSRTLLDQVVSGDSKGDTTGAGDNFVGGVIYSLANQMRRGVSKPDLYESVKWGIVSGGFACSYMGGTYLEQEPGEKLEKIRYYLGLYEEQLKNA